MPDNEQSVLNAVEAGPDTSEAEGEACLEAPPKRHNRGLLLIGLFKLGKALFFFLLGIGALHLIHRNLGDLTMKIASVLHFDPEGKLVDTLEDRADLVSGHELRQVGGASILYSVVALTEGYGLMTEQVWAEYLTIVLTIGALPWEIFELMRRATYSRWILLAGNIVILIYLLWLVRFKRRRRVEA